MVRIKGGVLGIYYHVPCTHTMPGPMEGMPQIVFFTFLKKKISLKNILLGFPGGAVVKNPPANAGDTGSSPGPGRSHMPRSN